VNKRLFLLVMLLLLVPVTSFSLEVYKKDEVLINAGWWGQIWAQSVSNMDTDSDGRFDDSLSDILMRRSYFYLGGTITQELGFFVHFASDKLGMDEMKDDSGNGLGSGVAVRDAWLNYKLMGNDLILQAGRMYVPFTRNYGTTSTKSMLTLDLDWGQGGHRSTIFYPSRVGRDDALAVWGNLLDDKLQYRFMFGDGEEDNAKNVDDSQRYAGRLSYSFFDPETDWFNAGTYLGKKRVLSLGFGADSQEDLVLAGRKQNYSAWTADLHYDQPLADGGNLTLTASYIDIVNSVNGISFTTLGSGDDGNLLSVKAGYLLPGTIGKGQLQPYGHYQLISVDESGKKDTQVYGVGLNYYIKGVDNKISLETTFVDQDKEIFKSNVQDETIITLQLAAGF